MKKLTPKQEKFAQLYVELGNASEAYRRSYNVKETTKDTTINVKASELLSNGNVSVRVKELQENLKQKNQITKQDIINYHLKMVKAWESLQKLGEKETLTKDEKQKFYLLKEMVKGSDYRGSLDSVTKMLGFNEPDKVDNNISIEIIEKKRD